MIEFCPTCGKAQEFVQTGDRVTRIRFEGKIRVINTTIWKCPDCGCGIESSMNAKKNYTEEDYSD